jgi:hypothetical protein
MAHDGAATTYYWEFINVPPNSIVSFSSPTSSAPTFTPDTIGSYLIKLTIDGDNLGSDTRVVAVKTNNLDIRIPAGGETNEYNNNSGGLDGWFESIYNAFVNIDLAVGNIDSKIIRSDGTGNVPTANISWGGMKITNLGAPSVSSDAARLQDIPTSISGLSTFSLALLNSRITDATLDNSSSTRTPSVHSLSNSFHTAISLSQLNALITDATLDNSSATRNPTAHGLGSAFHTSTTLSGLNALISDATLDSSTSQRDPFAHDFAGAKHTASTLAALNSKITDAVLLDQYDIDFNLVYSNGASLYLNDGPIILSGPTAATILNDGYIGLLESEDPTLPIYYGAIYTKIVSGVTELFYKDDNGNVIQLTSNGSLGPELNNYAEKILLDSYATTISLENYTEKTLLDSYATLFSLENYTEKTLSDSYATTISLNNYAEKTLLDGYVDKILLDGYAAISEFVGLTEQIADPNYYDNYGTLYSKDIDGYTELHYIDNYGNITQITSAGYDVILTSPNNIKWRLVVDDYGNLYTTSF